MTDSHGELDASLHAAKIKGWSEARRTGDLISSSGSTLMGRPGRNMSKFDKTPFSHRPPWLQMDGLGPPRAGIPLTGETRRGWYWQWAARRRTQVSEPPPERQIHLTGERRRAVRASQPPWLHQVRRRFYSDDRWYRYLEKTLPAAPSPVPEPDRYSDLHSELRARIADHQRRTARVLERAERVLTEARTADTQQRAARVLERAERVLTEDTGPG